VLAFFFGATGFLATTRFTTFFLPRELGLLASNVIATLSNATPAAAIAAAPSASALAPIAAPIAPSGNEALKKVTAPALRRFGINAFQVWKQLLVKPQDFISRTTEELFSPLVDACDANDGPWASYLRTRYKFVPVS
jgi:hypothetical protein